MENNLISVVDFVGVPTTDSERARDFYINTLGLKPDKNAKYDFWVGNTCFSIWEPAKMGMTFAPQKNAHIALHVEDVESVKKELEAKGVKFASDIMDTGVCYMALFTDPDGNDLMLHHHYKAREGEKDA